MRIPKYIHIFPLLMAFALLSCENGSDPVINHFVKLSESQIEFEALDETVKTIGIEANGEWEISNIPEWGVVNVDTENNRLEIEVLPNKSASDRESKIRISTGNSGQSLTIRQKGKEAEKEPFGWHAFSVNLMKSFSVSGDEANGFSYDFEAQLLFIRPSMKNDIYLGNVINRQSSSVSAFATFDDFVYRPINMTATGGNKFFFSEDELPSKKETERLRHEMMNDLPQESASFSYSSAPIVFRSYNYLRFLFMTNLGIDPVALVSGRNDTGGEMQKAYGLIYSYNHTLFQIVMDYPKKLIVNEPDKDFIADNHLSYISSIEYGKTAFLVVESDEPLKTTKGIIRKITRGELLDDEENAVVGNLDIHYLAFSSDDKLISIQSPDKIGLIGKFAGGDDNHIIPLSFMVNDYPASGIAYLKYRWEGIPPL